MPGSLDGGSPLPPSCTPPSPRTPVHLCVRGEDGVPRVRRGWSTVSEGAYDVKVLRRPTTSTRVRVESTRGFETGKEWGRGFDSTPARGLRVGCEVSESGGGGRHGVREPRVRRTDLDGNPLSDVGDGSSESRAKEGGRGRFKQRPSWDLDPEGSGKGPGSRLSRKGGSEVEVRADGRRRVLSLAQRQPSHPSRGSAPSFHPCPTRGRCRSPSRSRFDKVPTRTHFRGGRGVRVGSTSGDAQGGRGPKDGGGKKGASAGGGAARGRKFGV